EGDEQLMRALAAVERGDQGLDDRDGRIEGAAVAPRLERMRLRNVPVAQTRRLVVVSTEVHAERDLLQLVGEREIRRGVEDRVRAEDDEELDLALLHVGRERPDRRDRIRGPIEGRLAEEHGLAEVVERGVRGVRQGMDARGLEVAGDDDASPRRSLEIARDRLELREPDRLRFAPPDVP